MLKYVSRFDLPVDCLGCSQRARAPGLSAPRSPWVRSRIALTAQFRGSYLQRLVKEKKLMLDGSDFVVSATTPFGLMNYYSFDRPIGESIELYGQWAMAEIRFLSQFLNLGDTVIDGGANIGTHTLAFADACGPSGRVIAVEASPEVAQILRRNVKENGLGGVEQITAALGASAGTCRFSRLVTEGLQNVGMLCVVEGGDDQSTIEVPVITIDSLRLQSLRLLKLDIEGQELEALKGATETIDRLFPIVSVELLNLDKSIPIYNLLTGKGYKAFFCSVAVFESDNFRGEDRDIFGVAREASLLFIPRETEFQVTRGAIVLPVNSLDGLADSLREMPRFGDRTAHDRNIQALLEERADLERQLGVLQIASATASAESVAEELATIREENRVADESLNALKAEMASVREAIDRQKAEADALQVDMEEQRGKADANAALVVGSLTALRESQISDSVSHEASTVRLKTELSSLREALLGRGEDRSNLVLTVEALDTKVGVLMEQVARGADSKLSYDGLGGWNRLTSWFRSLS